MNRPRFANREWFAVLLFGFPAMFLGMYLTAPEDDSVVRPEPLAEQLREYREEGKDAGAGYAPLRPEQDYAVWREKTPYFDLEKPKGRRLGTVYVMGAVIVVAVAALVGWIWYE